jgi:hypothetical protein
MYSFTLYTIYFCIVTPIVVSTTSTSAIPLLYSPQVEICKYSIYCDNTINYCLQKTKTESPEIYNIALNSCPLPLENICNVYDSLLLKCETTNKCLPEEKNIPSYPGGTCITDSDCLYGKCMNSTCKDSDKDKICYIHENCPIGTACIQKQCKPYNQLGEPCSSSEECEFDLLCHQGKCIEAYSYDDGYKIDVFGHETERFENYCKNGGGYLIPNENSYICATLYNVNNVCREDCSYYINSKSNGTTMNFEDKCLCGYNRERSKHCILGNGEEKYKEFLSMRKEFIRNKEYTQYCHTTERKHDDICVELKKVNRTVSFRRYVQQYTNAKVIALEHHRLQNADSCVKNVMFNYNNEPIIPDIQQCPKVYCDYQQEECLKGFNSFSEKGDNISISLNDRVCNDNELCYINNALNSFEPIFYYQNINGKCHQLNTTNNDYYNRYPGEDCDNDNQCISTNSTCYEGKCTGQKETEYCVDSSNCIKGLYCSQSTHQCVPQKKYREKCEYTYECLNYYGCYNGVCEKYGSLKIEASLNEPYIKGDMDVNDKSLFCELGQTDLNGTMCALIDYANETKLRANADNDYFVECSKGEKCFYYDGKNYYSQECGCGYNNKGIGYCPLPNNYKRNEWVNRVKILAELTANNCHTKSRFHCYLNNNWSKYKEIRSAIAKTTEAHLFHNAISCAYNIFSNCVLIKVNYILIGIVLLFIN